MLYFLLLKMRNSLSQTRSQTITCLQSVIVWYEPFESGWQRLVETDLNGWLGIPADKSLGEPYGWIRPTSVPLRGGRDALLERYRQHLDICSSCRGAHKTLHALRECMTIAGILLLATSSALTGIAARPRRVAAVVGAGMLLLPQLLHRPLVRRLECAPWPRKEWVRPSPLRGLGNTSSPSWWRSWTFLAGVGTISFLDYWFHHLFDDWFVARE